MQNSQNHLLSRLLPDHFWTIFVDFRGLSFALTWPRIIFLIELSIVPHLLDILVLELRIKYNMTCHEIYDDMIVVLFAFPI